jgi:hypothetical protein
MSDPSHEVMGIAAYTCRKARQHQLNGLATTGPDRIRSEDVMPYRRLAMDALERWRAAERVMASAEPDSLEWRAASDDAAAAKIAYQEAFDAARLGHLPMPPSFEEATSAETTTDMSAVGDDGQVFGG